MKINIFLNIKKGAYGGGNQFLKALKEYFLNKNVYSENIYDADVILFNSHHQVQELIKLKKKYPEKIFIHRIDGPIFLIRKNNRHLDKLIYNFNDKIADASIFQSIWSKQKNIELGINANKKNTIIINAPNPQVFNLKNKSFFNTNSKTKIIATSWASNLNKGFDTYRFLDENLDFSKYEMTFCGNSPYRFKNIKMIKALQSGDLAKQLKKHDIYITASKNDPCSNSLVEALHCGLPSIGLNDGGHPEIIGKGGLVFNKDEDVIEKIKEIELSYLKFKEAIILPNISEIGKLYYDFIKTVFEQKQKNNNKIGVFDVLSLYKSIYLQKIIKNF